MSHPIATARALFDQAIEISSASERRAFLDSACADDLPLRREVESLLKAAEEAGSFLERPALASPSTGPHALASTGPDLAAVNASLTTDPHNRSDPADTPTGTDGPGSRIGPYLLQQLLGEGGMGAVYLARQLQPIRRPVALKIIRPGLASEHALARFRFEQQTLSTLDHPNIAHVLDAGTTPDGQPYFVMGYVPGKPVTDYCDHKRLTIRQRLELFVTLCQAVQYAHARGIMHRDLKPGNILVAEDEGKPLPRVIDFGLAKMVEQTPGDQPGLTHEGMALGTPLYMSPEQAGRGTGQLNVQTDVYSLGVILYELLTGTTPLEPATLKGLNWLKILEKVRNFEAPAPSVRAAGLGERLAGIARARQVEPGQLPRLLRGELDWITLKALEKETTRRYDTASALGREVQRYLDDEPVEASPPSLAYRLGKFARKNRAVLSAAAGFLALLLLGIVGLSVGLVVINGMRQRAESAEKTTSSLLDVSDAAVQVLLREQMKPDRQQQHRLGEIARELQQTLDALGEEPANRMTAAKGHARLARFYVLLNQPSASKASLRRAITLLETLQGQPSEEKERILSILGRCCYDLGVHLQHAGQLQEAEKLYSRALAALEQLPADSNDGLHQRDLADTYNNLGVLLLQKGELREAESMLRQAVTLGEPLLKDASASPFREHLASACHNLGNVLRDGGSAKGALLWYDKAIALRNEVKEMTRDSEVNQGLSYWDRANALGQLRRHAEAVNDWQNAIRLTRSQPKPALNHFLAAELVEKQLAGPKQPSGAILHHAARLIAQAGLAARAEDETKLAQRYADRTRALLEQARTSGYYLEASHLEALQGETNISRLLGPDFQSFLAGLGADKGGKLTPPR